MSSPPPASGRPYRVEFPGILLDRILELGQQAIRQGHGPEFTAAVRRIIERLETDPVSWGEAIFDLSSMGINAYQAADAPIHISYGIDEQHHVVYIKSVALMPLGPSAPDEFDHRNGHPPSS